jgi:CHRD domain
MLRLRLISVSLPLIALGCADPVGESLMAPVTVTRAQDDGPQNFQTHLHGEEEVPSRETLAQGNAKFQLSKDGRTMSYKVIASNIDNAFMTHIHLAPAGTNGGIVVWLRPTIPNGVAGPESQVRQDGVFAEGEFTSANFVGALAGKSMEDLLAAIRDGRAYVNVHTRNLALPAAQAEAGNFPGGEVRGQIDHGNGM